VRFWDASAVVPLVVEEPQRESMLRLLESDAVMVVWWGTLVECTSAISRRERDGSLSAGDTRAALERLRYIEERWQEILPTTAVRETARRLLRVHPLRAADSLQLAAAIIAAEREPETLELVCLDDRLSDAAAREGFKISKGEE